MKETSIFQTILLVVFGLFIIIGMAMFSLGGKDGGDGGDALGDVVVWGTLSEGTVSSVIREVYSEKASGITYVEKEARTFDRDLVEALASGVGPDIVLLPQDLILRHSDKIYSIPYESLSIRDFKNRFIEEGELYLNENGILGLPFVVDPMVMYWNRDLFSSAGISLPPSFWDEFYTITPILTLRGNNLDIKRSAISFGEFRNVTHAKDILALLILQAGNPIVIEKESGGGAYESTLSDSFNYSVSPAEAALRFYTEFSNPSKTSYSWNRSLPMSRDMFVAGDLAIYFGFARELSDIERKNPHLNFDIAEIPQTRDSAKKTTFANMQGLSILKASKNIPGSFHAAILLSDNKFISALSEELGLPPVRRDLLSKKPADENLLILYGAALISRSWLDPSPDATETIFKNMVESVVSGRSKVSEAVSMAEREVSKLLK